MCDDVLRHDTQLKVVHCFISWNSMLLWLSSLSIVPVPLLGGAAPQDCGTVSQFVELWPAFSTCSTFWGSVPHFWNTVPHMELFHFVSVYLDSWILPKYWHDKSEFQTENQLTSLVFQRYLHSGTARWNHLMEINPTNQEPR